MSVATTSHEASSFLDVAHLKDKQWALNKSGQPLRRGKRTTLSFVDLLLKKKTISHDEKSVTGSFAVARGESLAPLATMCMCLPEAAAK